LPRFARKDEGRVVVVGAGLVPALRGAWRSTGGLGASPPALLSSRGVPTCRDDAAISHEGLRCFEIAALRSQRRGKMSTWGRVVPRQSRGPMTRDSCRRCSIESAYPPCGMGAGPRIVVQDPCAKIQGNGGLGGLPLDNPHPLAYTEHPVPQYRWSRCICGRRVYYGRRNRAC